MNDLNWLLDEHCTVTRWSDSDGEYVATFTEPELLGLSGLGPTSHDSICELRSAYKVWLMSLITLKDDNG